MIMNNMAAKMNCVRYFTLFLFFYINVLVKGDHCPQRAEDKGPINEKARSLSGLGVFLVEDEKKEYQYRVDLCCSENKDLSIDQIELGEGGKQYIIGGSCNEARMFGGSDWLIIQYTGTNSTKYRNHCSKTKRKAIVYIRCDESADTKKARQPEILEEYRPDEPKADFCYYLFEMKHDGVCPDKKTKISPGSVFIIIIVIVGFLYLLLGFLYQRFIVGAKGMEQIPNYLMWREFGSLQADGCNFMCRCKGTQQPTRYKPMDDAIADDEDFSEDMKDENDDAMLPM